MKRNDRRSHAGAVLCAASAVLLCALLSAGCVLQEKGGIDMDIGLGDSGEDEAVTIAWDPVTTQYTEQLIETDGSFNAGWKFSLGEDDDAKEADYPDTDWESVTLPHDFSISQEFTAAGEAESGYLPGGMGWYRKDFSVSEEKEGQLLHLTFDGVYGDAYVYVNGNFAGENHYGYSSFTVDITPYVHYGEEEDNVIAVKAVNDQPNSRWYSGSGIYRDVTLRFVPRAHIADCGVHVTTPDIGEGIGTVQIETKLENESTSRTELTVEHTVYGPDGEEALRVSDEVSLYAGATYYLLQTGTVRKPTLWDLDSPELYTVRTRVYENNRLSQTQIDRFGFRSFFFAKGAGFRLNGKNVKINGVCLHHDQGALGAAADEDALRRQITKLKEMGCNAIRTSHNPHARTFVEMCDEMGMLILEDCFDGWDLPKNENVNDFSSWFLTSVGSEVSEGADADMTWAEFAMRRIMLRDRNSPSVIAWCIGNEITESAGVSQQVPKIGRMFTWIAEDVDGERPLILANNKSTEAQILEVVDETITNDDGIAGLNDATAADYDAYLDTYGVVLGTKTTSAVSSRGIYQNTGSDFNADDAYHITSYDTTAAEGGLTAHESIYNTYTRDNVVGEFVSAGFDYIGEPVPWNETAEGVKNSALYAAPNSSYVGIIDTAGFEKDSYYLYQSQWRKDGAVTVHLVTAWDSENAVTEADGKTRVDVYSNAPVIRLYRDGERIGSAVRRDNTTAAGYTYYTYTAGSENGALCEASANTGAEALYCTFRVQYADGTLEAKAFEADGVTEITETLGRGSVTTPGAAAKIQVTVEGSETAVGGSLKYIDIDITDANGVPDTTAAQTLSVSLSGNGTIVGVDNGDQATTRKYQQKTVLLSDTEAEINAFSGKALVIVRTADSDGIINMKVSAAGLEEGAVSFQTRRSGSNSSNVVSYRMVREYSVREGNTPALQDSIIGILADGNAVNGRIAWDNLASSDLTVGDHAIAGTATISGAEPFRVKGLLHVVGDISALLNCSAVTTPGVVPDLPESVSGVLANGALSGTYQVQWMLNGVDFSKPGSVVKVSGVGSVFGDESLPVTCSVRVTERSEGGGTNVAKTASGITCNPSEAAGALEFLRDGIIPGTAGSVLGTCWLNVAADLTGLTAADGGNLSADAAEGVSADLAQIAGDIAALADAQGTALNVPEKSSITFTWTTVQSLDRINLYYYADEEYVDIPEAVKLSYSTDGQTFTEIGYEEPESTEAFRKTTYVLSEIIRPAALRISFTGQNDKAVGLVEAEVMSYEPNLTKSQTAELSSLAINGEEVALDPNRLGYVDVAKGTVTAEAKDNAAVTILPRVDAQQVILVQSEDGKKINMYTLQGEKEKSFFLIERLFDNLS